MASDLPEVPLDEEGLPDPEAYLKLLTREQVEAYAREFGKGSRESILAKRELRRRGGRFLKWSRDLAVIAVISATLFWLM